MDGGRALNHPQVEPRDMSVSVEHASAGTIDVLGIPIKRSATPGSIRSAPPTLGEQTDQILTRDLGVTLDELAELRELRVI
jgi:crotonobetainyl-CoA:carnitine CoA-transferase CaiB-like acyl-CoA transferase